MAGTMTEATAEATATTINKFKHPMWRAAYFGDISTVQRLLDFQESPWGRIAAATEEVGIERSTPLHAAVIFKNEDVVRILIENGADVLAKDASGQTPLHSSAKRGNGYRDLTELLIFEHKRTHPNDTERFLEIKTNNGDTPLILAARSSRTVSQLLLSHGANVNAANHSKETPLHTSMQRHCAGAVVQTVDLLLQNGADVNAITIRGETVLHVAVRHHSIVATRHLIDLLLKNGADVNALTIRGETVLHTLVSKAGSPYLRSAIERLFDAGVDTACRTVDGLTAEDTAARVGNADAAGIIRAESYRRECVESMEAFAMGGVPRIGTGSRVQWLDPGVVDMVLEELKMLYRSDPYKS